MFDDQLTYPVELLYFSNKNQCETYEDSRRLLEEITNLSDRLIVSNYPVDENPQLAEKHNVQRTPGMVIASPDQEKLLDNRNRFALIPSRHEFSRLLQVLILVSKRGSGSKSAIRNQLNDVKKPFPLHIFVTSTSPYCLHTVLLAHQMAMERPMIQAEMIEANEFYELAMRYNVSDVPHTTINSGVGMIMVGTPEEYVLQEIQLPF